MKKACLIIVIALFCGNLAPMETKIPYEIWNLIFKYDKKYKLNFLYVNKFFNRRITSLITSIELKNNFLNKNSYDVEILFKSLSAFINLKKLNLRGCVWLNKRSLTHLTCFTNLEDIDLSYFYHFEINDDILFRLGMLTNLEKINLSHCYNITNNGLAHLQKLSNLKYINLAYCNKVYEDINSD